MGAVARSREFLEMPFARGAILQRGVAAVREDELRWTAAHLLVEVRAVELEGRAREREESESRHGDAERASEALIESG